MVRMLLVVMLLAVGCSSATSTGPAPEVKLVQTTSVPDLLLQDASGLPMQYRLDIANPFEHPVTLVSVEIESVGSSGAYAMRRVRHAFDRVIPARSKDSIHIRAWVQRLQVDLKGDANNPVMLRGTARFATADGTVRRNFVARGQ